MANELFIKHKFVNEIPDIPEPGAIYFERDTNLIKAVESESKIVIAGVKRGEGENSAILNDLNNVASGANSLAEGSNNTASGQGSHVEGSSSVASGEFTHAEGYNTTAAGKYSHTEGYGTETKNEGEHAQGRWNISSDTPGEETIDTIGYGTGSDARKNIYELHRDGSQFLIGVGDYDGTNASTAESVQEVILELQEKVVNITPEAYQTKQDDTLATNAKTVSGAINELFTNSQTKTDTTLETTSKTVVGAINELKTSQESAIDNKYLDVTTLFADTASLVSETTTKLAAFGEGKEMPVLYGGETIGKIVPTWIRTVSGITNMMCLADNKIYYFEITADSVQRSELAISQ